MRMRQNLQITITLLIVSFAFINCENNIEPFEQGKTVTIRTRCAIYTEFLDVTENNIARMSSQDIRILEQAKHRLGFHCGADGYYETNGLTFTEANISESLYNLIQSHKIASNDNIRYINEIVRSKSKRRRIKFANEEGGGVSQEPDCVMHAVSHVQGCTASYQQVRAYCNATYPDWKKNGGVPTDAIGSILQHFGLQRTEHDGSSLATLYHSDHSFNNEVALIRNGAHAVNIIEFIPTDSLNNSAHFYYNDYQTGNMTVTLELSHLTSVFLP